MREFQRATEAVRVPSRAEELRRELAQASADDLTEMLRRTTNQSKRKRIKKEIAKREHA